MTRFDIVVVKSGLAAVVQVRGELDLSSAPRLDRQLLSLAEEGVLDVIVDLSDLDFIDSSGLQALVAGLKRLREQGGNLALRSPKPSARKVLEITGLTHLFRLESAIEEGVESIDALSESGARHVDRQMTGEQSRVGVD